MGDDSQFVLKQLLIVFCQVSESRLHTSQKGRGHRGQETLVMQQIFFF